MQELLPVLWGLQELHYLLFFLSFFLCLPWQFSLLYVQVSTHSMTWGDPLLIVLFLCGSIISYILNLQILSTLTHMRFQLCLLTFAILPCSVGFVPLPCSLEAAPRHYVEANVELTLPLSLSSGISFLCCMWPNVCKPLLYMFCVVLQLFNAAGQIQSLLLHLG